VLKLAFPQHPWLPWKFKPLPRNFWADVQHQQQFLNWLGVKLGNKTFSDWYHVNYDDFAENGGP